MARGNQRDLARAKNLAKQGAAGGDKRTDGIPVNKRKEHDAEIMRQKQAKKAAEAAEAAAKK